MPRQQKSFPTTGPGQMHRPDPGFFAPCQPGLQRGVRGVSPRLKKKVLAYCQAREPCLYTATIYARKHTRTQADEAVGTSFDRDLAALAAGKGRGGDIYK